MIVKIQRCLNPPDGPALVYNQDKSYIKELDFKLVAELFTNNEEKVYCKAETNDKGGLMIGDRVAEPNW